jgi:hypothetical protein
MTKLLGKRSKNCPLEDLRVADGIRRHFRGRTERKPGYARRLATISPAHPTA